MGWLITGILFMLTFIMALLAQSGAPTPISSSEAGEMAVIAVISAVCFAKYHDIKTGGPEKREKAKELERQKAVEAAEQIPGTPERIRKLQADACVEGTHMAGLPVPEGAEFYIYLGKDDILFERNESEYHLLFEKITDITIKTDVEIQNAYVSSIAGAVGGAVLFGPLGAMVGGRVQKKTDQRTNYYLIFAYIKESETEFISFEIRDELNAKKFTEFFRALPKEKKSVIL